MGQLAVGAGSYGYARLSLTRFNIEAAELCGVHVGLDGEVDLVDGEVSACAIGACVNAEGYDLDRISGTVRYRDNAANLDTTALPVPDPGVDLVPLGP